MGLEFYATARFKKSFADSPFQDLLLREIKSLHRFLISRNRGELNRWPVDCKPIHGTPKSAPAMREWRMTIRGRIIFTDEQNPKLVDISPKHDAVEAFVRLGSSQISAILADSQPLAGSREWDTSSKSTPVLELANVGSFKREKYLEEQYNDWVYFLDQPQIRVRDQVLSTLVTSSGWQTLLIMGGAGTGKTALLTNLAFQLEELGLQPALVAQTGVRNYLKKTQRSIPGLCANTQLTANESVVLLDDPISFDSMQTMIQKCRQKDIPLVIGIDPTQWHERRLAERWASYEKAGQFKAYFLHQNYRQGRYTGEPALNAIRHFFSESSAFMAEAKVNLEHLNMKSIREKCLEEVSFVDELGGHAIHEQPLDLEVLKLELKKIAMHENGKDWPNLLVGFENEFDRPRIKAILDEFAPKLTYHLRSFSSVADVRGTEYDFVILMVPALKWNTITSGKFGAGTEEWVSLNTTLTFLTRAKNHFSVYKTNEIWLPGFQL